MTWYVGAFVWDFLQSTGPMGFNLDTWRNLVTIVAFFMPFVLGGALYWGAKVFITRGEHLTTRKETSRNISELKNSDVQVRDLVHVCIGRVDVIEGMQKENGRDRAGLHEHVGRFEEQVMTCTTEMASFRERLARLEERMHMRRKGND